MVLLENDAFDQELQAEVGPRDWTNPQPAERYDLFVLGGGTAGLVAAAGAAGLGAKVALVERDLMGGDCLNYGCVPSKALLRAAKTLGEVSDAESLGVKVDGPASADFAAVMERMRRLRASIGHHDGAQRFTELGVDVFLGSGKFSGPDRAEVNGNDGTTVELKFKRALIATGARPLVFPVPGVEEAGYLTNLSLFALTELPKRMVVVGGGPIGCEMAQAFARFGTEVTIVSLDDHLLPREDADAAAIVQNAMVADGVRLELGARLERVETEEGGKRVYYSRQGSPAEGGSVLCDELLLAMGRKANTDGLGLEAAGVAAARNGIEVDDKLRTANRRIYAAGDVAGMWQFTHAADAMARIVLRNAFFFGRSKASALTMPWSTYTMPEVAHVGLYENQAAEAGTELTSLKMDFSEIDRAILDGETAGYAKVIFEAKSGRLRGATVVAPHAGELLGEVLIAVTRGLKVYDLASVIHPYPTQVSIWGRLGDQSMRRKLTPFASKMLKTMIRWTR